MKRILVFLVFMLFAVVQLNAKEVKISVVPETAKIYVDGNYVGDGIVTVPVKGDFINLKFELSGYVTIHTKFFKNDKRKAISYNMREDTFFLASEQSDNVNKYFSLPINKEYYTISETGERDFSQAWKIMHQILLGYFDEIESSDQATGFIQTPWVYKSFPEADIQTRVRVTISEANTTGELAFRVKVSCETAGMSVSRKDENFKQSERLLKKFEPLIEELQSRVGASVF